jgi:acyl-CoA thioesterase
VRTIRSGKATESLGVSIHQDGRPIFEAMVLAVAESEPDVLAHDVTEMPDVPAPRSLRSVRERLEERGEPFLYPFWASIDSRAIQWRDEWPPTEPLDPHWLQWQRFADQATFDDPWIDAARSVMWIDIGGWPAANGHHAWRSRRGSR